MPKESSLDGLLNIAKTLNIDTIKSDLFKLYNLSEEQQNEVNKELEKENIEGTVKDLTNLQKDLKDTFE
jgi:hypothetical protein